MDTLTKVLDPLDTTTGGGSASAIAGAMAGALLAMVSHLSGAAQDEDRQPYFERIFTHTGQLSQQLLQGSQKDANAFQSVRHAYQLARQTEEEKTTRQQAIQAAWLIAAHVPLENAEYCLQVYELGVELADHVKPDVISDFNCALLLARAGLLGCLENVKINLPAIKDNTQVSQMKVQINNVRDRLTSLELSLEMQS